MMLRVLALVFGITGAAATSQFPEFSQQYMQRLAGKVEELNRFVAEFDSDARKLDLSRGEALTALAEGGAIGAERAQTMTRTIERQERLSAALENLRDAGPFERAKQASAFTDTELARGTLNDFKPAIPLTFEGLVFAVIGFVGGYLIFALPSVLLRRR